MEERLTVGTEVQQVRAVRVRIETEDRDPTVRLERSEQHYDIERVPIKPPVDTTREPWIEGETLVVPHYVEALVVVRRWRPASVTKLDRSERAEKLSSSPAAIRCAKVCAARA